MNKSSKNFPIVFFLLFFTPILNAQSVWDKPAAALSEPTQITVYRSPTCGCCGKWLEHLKKHGFEVKDIKTEEMSVIKGQLGVPQHLGSCHTALVNGYIIEGHAPAGDIIKLLQDKPDIAGLTVPGMVTGSPGMEMGGDKEPFAVFSFDKKGKTEKFREYLFY